MTFCCCPQLAIPLRVSGFLKCHGYEFIFKKERHLLDRKGIITSMMLQAYKYIVCDEANSYVDANARNQIQGFYVQCCLYFKQEWQSSKCKAEQGQEFSCT